MVINAFRATAASGPGTYSLNACLQLDLSMPALAPMLLLSCWPIVKCCATPDSYLTLARTVAGAQREEATRIAKGPYWAHAAAAA